MRSNRTCVAAWAVVAVLLPLGTGCAGGLTTQRVAGTPHAAGTGSTDHGEPAHDDDAILAAVALKESELPDGASLQLFEAGDQVVGQVTLDLCGATFPSEERRTARLQNAVVDADGQPVASNENVTYDSPDSAAQALSELRHAVAACPKDRYVRSTLSDVPPTRWAFRPVPEATLDGLATQHVVIDAVLTTQDGHAQHVVAAYQWRGRVMAVAYDDDLDGVLGYARTLRAHLDALPAADVGE